MHRSIKDYSFPCALVNLDGSCYLARWASDSLFDTGYHNVNTYRYIYESNRTLQYYTDDEVIASYGTTTLFIGLDDDMN